MSSSLDLVLLAVSELRKKTITSIYFRSKYNKTITRFGTCDIFNNNQGLGNGYRSRPSVSADNLYLDLD